MQCMLASACSMQIWNFCLVGSGLTNACKTKTVILVRYRDCYRFGNMCSSPLHSPVCNAALVSVFVAVPQCILDIMGFYCCFCSGRQSAGFEIMAIGIQDPGFALPWLNSSMDFPKQIGVSENV